METSVGVQFGTTQSTYEDYIILEQAEYPSGTGYTTKADIVNIIGNTLYTAGIPVVDCGMDGDSFSTTVYAYPSRKELDFFVGSTYGSVADGVLQHTTVTETVNFKLEAEASVKYPVESLVDVSWVGRSYNDRGAVIDPPALTFEDRTIYADKYSYSQATVTYKTFRVGYSVSVSPREDSVENVYQSVFYAVFDGGVVMLEVEAPPGAEDDYSNDTTCGFRSIVNITGPDDSPPTVDQNNTRTHVDYCSQVEK